LKDSIVKVVTPFLASSSQYRGFTGDGVYKHTQVGEKLDNHFGRRGVFTHDLMHKAALVDTKMRNPKAKDEGPGHAALFSWLNSHTQTIGASVDFIKWGMEWAHYFELYSQMVEEKREVKVLRPKTFSETKMANHSAAVYTRFREIVPALLATMEEVRLEYAGAGGGSEGSEKVQKAQNLMRRVYNVTFLLSNSALVDIYSIYSFISNNFQVVDMLVFERLDNFETSLAKLKGMMTSLKLDDCCCSVYFNYKEGQYVEDEENDLEDVDGSQNKKKQEQIMKEICQWPVLHADIREMMVQSMYRGVVVGCLGEEGSQTRAGNQQTQRMLVLDLVKVVDMVLNRASSVITFLHKHLLNVYSGTEVIIINDIRRLLDLKTTIHAVERSGAANYSTVSFRGWAAAARNLEPDLFARISEAELKSQYRLFMGKLEELMPTTSNLDNAQIFGLFINSALGHYINIQSVLGILANASVVMGLESVVESWVSVLEHHNNPRRFLSQSRLEEEGMVAINGPIEVHSNSVVQEALGNYWRKQKMVGNWGGHWVRRTSDIRPYVVSEAVDNIVNQPPTVPFMSM
jgi:hypothetical protein